MVCLSADEGAPLVDPQLEQMGQIHPSLSQHMSAMLVSAVDNIKGAPDSSCQQECVFKTGHRHVANTGQIVPIDSLDRFTCCH